MTSISLCALLVLAAEPTSGPNVRVYEFSPQLAAVIRAQSPDPAFTPSAPMMTAPAAQPGPTLGTPMPVSPDMGNPYLSPQMDDPFLYGPDPVLQGPYGGGQGMPAPIYAGVNGPQPYRMGWIPRLDIGYMPPSDLKGIPSDIEIFELDAELRHNSPFSCGWVYSRAFQFDYRAWNTDNALTDLYRINLYRFGYDMELIKMKANGWTLAFDFNPSINADFEHNLTSEAWNFDGRVTASYQVDPALNFVFGVQYWDRVDDIILPYGGVVFTPNDLWEYRLTFPQARISRFMGFFWGGHHWAYASAEYRVESYQIDTSPLGATPRNQVQYEDWQIALGLRSDHVRYDKYLEIAWVLGRSFEFKDTLGKFDADDTILIRGGIRF
ncbi:MAG: hypothetical protein SH850_27045 [Planctomycetaceae bacterium]|nr:hypothetical protein [Planctomycetaceae bacterium]